MLHKNKLLVHLDLTAVIKRCSPKNPEMTVTGKRRCSCSVTTEVCSAVAALALTVAQARLPSDLCRRLLSWLLLLSFVGQLLQIATARAVAL
jgi:hypothetical protein